jgi:hypothetical protein
MNKELFFKKKLKTAQLSLRRKCSKGLYLARIDFKKQNLFLKNLYLTAVAISPQQQAYLLQSTVFYLKKIVIFVLKLYFYLAAVSGSSTAIVIAVDTIIMIYIYI